MLEKTAELEATEDFLEDYRYNLICEWEEIPTATAEKIPWRTQRVIAGIGFLCRLAKGMNPLFWDE